MVRAHHVVCREAGTHARTRVCVMCLGEKGESGALFPGRLTCWSVSAAARVRGVDPSGEHPLESTSL